EEALPADGLPAERDIEAVLAYHDADSRAAIGTLLEDVRSPYIILRLEADLADVLIMFESGDESIINLGQLLF
ncbi:hypothetical protein ACC704_37990, partial [Rhizobium johnstonii]